MTEIPIETGSHGEETFVKAVLGQISVIFQFISQPFLKGFCFNMGHFEAVT